MAEKEKRPTVAEWAEHFTLCIDHVFRRGGHYIYDGRCYRRREDQLMLRLVLEMINSTYPESAAAEFVGKVVATIAIQSAIVDGPAEPLRIDGQPVGNIAVFENGTLDIGVLIEEKLREPKRISCRS